MESKYFFEKFKKDIPQEKKRFDAYSESTVIEKNTCKHKSLKIVGNELRCLDCQCGWMGPKQQLIEVMRQLCGN